MRAHLPHRASRVVIAIIRDSDRALGPAVQKVRRKRHLTECITDHSKRIALHQYADQNRAFLRA